MVVNLSIVITKRNTIVCTRRASYQMFDTLFYIIPFYSMIDCYKYKQESSLAKEQPGKQTQLRNPTFTSWYSPKRLDKNCVLKPRSYHLQQFMVAAMLEVLEILNISKHFQGYCYKIT